MTASALLPMWDFQRKAVASIFKSWREQATRPATVLPTGSGKTVVFAHLAEQYLAANKDKRVLVLAHTDELVNQAVEEMHPVTPDRGIGIIKGTRNETDATVIVASVQSLRTPARRDQVKDVGLIIVDECHHATAATYRAILQHYGALPKADAPEDWQPTCHAAGFTATLVRGDKDKLSDIWQTVAFRLSVAFMVRAGFLLDVRGKRIEVPDLDLGKVKVTGGDFDGDSLGEALDRTMAPEIAAKAYVEHCPDDKGLVFAPNVDSAHSFANAFNEVGIKTEVVHGKLPIEERRAIRRRLRAGVTQVVSNCMVLTEGFNEPSLRTVVIARATKSPGLYQQMVGRVLRPDRTLPVNERGTALVLDIVGASRKHGLASLVDLTTREDRTEEDFSEDLSLLEMEDLFEEELQQGDGGGVVPPAYYSGPVAVREFDPLSTGSKRTWGKTPDGHYYLAAGTGGYVFLVDSLSGDPGTYDVVWCAKVHKGAGSASMTEHCALSFDMAIAWAEEEATERGGFGTVSLTTKKAKWRKEPATGNQLYKLRGVGVTVDRDSEGRYVVDGEQLTKGMASELIEAKTAAYRIDPLVAAVKCRTQGGE